MSEAEYALCLDPVAIEPFDRGAGVVTLPYVGSWNSEHTTVTTGVTVFSPGTGLPLHTHNVEETVMVLSGEANVTIGDEQRRVAPGWVTWVPPTFPTPFSTSVRGSCGFTGCTVAVT